MVLALSVVDNSISPSETLKKGGLERLVQPISVVGNSRQFWSKGRCHRWTPSDPRGILAGISRLNSPRRLHENRIPTGKPPDCTRNSHTVSSYSPINFAQSQAAARDPRAKAQDTQTSQAQNRRRLSILSRRKGIMHRETRNLSDSSALE